MTDWSNANWVDPSLGWKPLAVPDLPSRVLIDFATRCNLRCPMCTVWGSDDEDAIASVKGGMPEDAALRMLDEMAPAKPMVQPNMYGEPLLIPNLERTLRALTERGMEIAFNTNGLNMSEPVMKMLVELDVPSVSFSIDATTPETLKRIRGISRLEQIEAAVFRLLAERGNRLRPRISVSFTVQDDNRHETDAFIERWASVVDCVRVAQIFKDGAFADTEVPADRQPCRTLYNTLPVFNDGVATLCCLDGFKETAVGNVFEEGVKGVWQGENLAKARYFHETGQWDRVPFCAKCNAWAQYEYQEEVRDGMLIRRSPPMTYYNRIDRLENWQGQLLQAHKRTP